MKVSVNNKYFIRNEKGCSYIIYADNIIRSKAEKCSLINPIPPFLGFLLTFFNGKDFEDSIKQASSFFSISEAKIQGFVHKILANESIYLTSFNGEDICLPNDLLIESSQAPKTYTDPEALPFEPFKPHRLSAPAYVNIFITSKCQTDCVYCYADRSRKDDMQTSTILQTIDEAQKGNAVNIALSGGDIFANKDWRLILQRLHEYNYEPMLSTKIPLSEEDILFLKGLEIKEIQYSIDSLEPAIIEKNLGISGTSYSQKIKDTITCCNKYNLDVNIKTVLTKFSSTIENVEQMLHYFSQFNCITSWNIMPAFCSTYREDYETYRSCPDALATISEYLEKKHPHFTLYTQMLKSKTTASKKFQTTEEFVEKNKGCTANTYSICVLSNGKVSICEMLYYNELFYIGDVSKNSIQDIWNSPKALALYHFKETANKNTESPCYNCAALQSCKKDFLKKICYADIIHSFGAGKWDYPDPRCPKAPECDLEKIM